MKQTDTRTPRASFASGWARRALAMLAIVILIAGAAGCSSGGGGDNGHSDTGDGGSAPGLTFTYPADGQTDVFTQTQMAIAYAGAAGDPDALQLIADPDGDAEAVDIAVSQPGDGIVRLALAGPADAVERPALQPDTTYAVRDANRTLYRFTTRPADGSPAAGGFAVVEHRGDSADAFPFTQFNTIRLTFSEPVDPATVRLGDTFTVTDSGGAPVAGRLNALGRYLSFDPAADLDADETYTITLATGDGDDAVRSVFGNGLQANGEASFELTPVSVGNDVHQNLVFEPTGDDPEQLPPSALNGDPANLVSLVSQLVGRNLLPADQRTTRGGLVVRLAEPSDDSRYRGTFPNLIPGGQQFDLGELHLRLGGVPTQVNSGPIEVRFIDDADVYIIANNLSGLSAPAAVRLRFDLGIGARIEDDDEQQTVANGVFNQTIMNIRAAGLAIPQDNGDLKLITLGSFPTAVNRNGRAITDFELELTLKARNQRPVQPDATQPYLTAQYPSACLYTFGA